MKIEGTIPSAPNETFGDLPIGGRFFGPLGDVLFRKKSSTDATDENGVPCGFNRTCRVRPVVIEPAPRPAPLEFGDLAQGQDFVFDDWVGVRGVLCTADGMGGFWNHQASQRYASAPSRPVRLVDAKIVIGGAG